MRGSVAASVSAARWDSPNEGAPVTPATGRSPGPGRALRLTLAAIWLLDAVLQYQPAMYDKGFAQMLAGTADGNPPVIARPITWDAALVAHHLLLANTIFATIQLLIGLGIAFGPTVRPALAASIAWSLGVWWLGEGLGGVLNGTASPLNGAPGAVIIYALLAVVLWPADRAAPVPFAAARAVGGRVARGLWLVLWLGLAYFALTPENRAPQAMNGLITAVTDGLPGWLAGIDKWSAALVSGQGLAASVVLAAALAVIAVGVYLPRAAARATLVLALVVAAVIWAVGEGFGMIPAGGATDPNSGLLLGVLAVAYWPGAGGVAAPGGTAAAEQAVPEQAATEETEEMQETEEEVA